MLKTVTLLIYFILFSVLAVGCAKDSLDPVIRAHLERPDWISGDDGKYIPSLFLTGRGVSSDKNKARQQSAEDLTQNFDRQILESTKKDHSQDSQENLGKQLDQKTRDFLLRHIRVSETWQDPATHAFHVLSTIDRVQVGDEMLNEIYRLDEQIDRILEKANSEKDVLQRIAFANLALEKQNQRDKLVSFVKIIKPISSAIISRWSLRKIQGQISTWLNEVKIMPIAQHKDFNLMGALKKGVSSAGMTVHLGANPDYILKASFEQGQIKWKDGVYSLHGNLKLMLLDGEWKGQVRGDASWPIDVTALERNQLPEQLTKAIINANRQNLRNTLLAIEE